MTNKNKNKNKNRKKNKNSNKSKNPDKGETSEQQQQKNVNEEETHHGQTSGDQNFGNVAQDEERQNVEQPSLPPLSPMELSVVKEKGKNVEVGGGGGGGGGDDDDDDDYNYDDYYDDAADNYESDNSQDSDSYSDDDDDDGGDRDAESSCAVKKKKKKVWQKLNTSDMFATWEEEVDGLHQMYLSLLDGDSTEGEITKGDLEEALNQSIDVLERVNNPIYKKVQFNIVCEDIGRVYHHKPIPNFTLVDAFKEECKKHKDNKGSMRRQFANAMRKLLTTKGVKGLAFTWLDEDDTRLDEDDTPVAQMERVDNTGEGSSELILPQPPSPPSSPPPVPPQSFVYEYPYEKTDTVKVMFTGENEAELLLSSCAEHQYVASIKVSVERMEEEYLCQYISNLKKLIHKSQFVKLRYVITDKEEQICLLVDRYKHRTLKEVAQWSKSKFWIEVKLDRPDEYEDWRKSMKFDTLVRPSPYFQNMLRQIVDALVVLYESDIPFDLSLSKVVFFVDDKEDANPKLRHIFTTAFPCEPGFEDVRKLAGLFRCLRKVIHEIMDEHGVHDAFIYVNEFLKVIDSLKKPRLRLLIHHPFMWSSHKKRLYYLDWQNALRFQNLSRSMEKWPRFLRKNFVAKKIFLQWDKQVEQHSFFQKRILYATQRFKSEYGPDVFSLMKFIRDMYVHLNTKMVNSKDGEGNLEGFDFEKEPTLEWTDERFDTILEFWCPHLAAFLVEFTPETHFTS